MTQPPMDERLRALLPERVFHALVQEASPDAGRLMDHLSRVYHALATFLPSGFLERKRARRETPPVETLQGTFLFLDVSGFTPISERLARKGQRGAEELALLVNRFFTPLVEEVRIWGGEVIRFAGDALMAYFPGDLAHSAPRAAAAARACLEHVEQEGTVRTEVGVFQIRMHAALAGGRARFLDLGNDYALTGRVLHRLMEVEDHARVGDILAAQELVPHLRPLAVLRRRRDGVFRVGRFREFPSRPEKPSPPVFQDLTELVGDLERLRPYVPAWLYARIAERPTFSPKDGEHRTLGVVFLRFRGRLGRDPLEIHARYQELYAHARRAVEAFEGTITRLDVDRTGHRLLAVFGYPHAVEDAARRTCLFLQEMADLPGWTLAGGLHRGRVFVGPVGSDLRREITVMGDVANVAARLAGAARGGAFLTTAAVHRRVAVWFDVRDRGEVRLKGKRQPVRLYRLEGRKRPSRERLALGTGPAVLVGREREMDRLRKAARQAEAGRGQVVAVVGEAGIGKSRLIREALTVMGETFEVVVAGCESYGSALPFHLWSGVLEDLLDLPELWGEARGEKVVQAVRDLHPSLLEWLPLLGDLVGVNFPETPVTRSLDAQLRKQRMLDLLLEMLVQRTRNRPLLLVLEDLHWSDRASMDGVNHIARSLENLPVFLLLSYRSIPREPFMDLEHFTSLHLRELSVEEARQLLFHLLEGAPVPRALEELILARAQGNPFYVEELTRVLVERGILRKVRGRWKLQRGRYLVLPDTVEGVILGRMDALDLAHREVLQHASVLGTEFERFLLDGIVPHPEHLDAILPGLRDLEFLHLGEPLRFKHALIRDVAYGTLSFARRRDLHRKVAVFLENTLSDRLQDLEVLGMLSHHWFFAEDYEKALRYSFEAGERAREAYANHEAIAFYTRAIESFERLEQAGKVEG